MKFDLPNLLKPKSQPLVGIDISSSMVKIVELSQGPKGYVLEAYSMAPLPKDAIVDGAVNGLDKVSDTVVRAHKLLGTKTRRAALALPVAAVITKKVIMQGGLREEDMEVQVEAEANQYIPFPLEEVNLDFQVVGEAPNNPDENEVLIAAARKEKIDDRVAAAEEAGLKVAVMDVETFATEAAYSLVATQLPNNGIDQTIMIVDIGANMMHVNVLVDNESVYNREQHFGGTQLTQDIQRRFGLSPEESEIAKRKGGLPESYEPEVLQPFVQSLATEVARAVQFFTSSTHYNKVDHIVLAGGCAAIKSVDLLVQEQTQVSTIVANPFVNMTLAPRIKQQALAQDAPALMIACGLALRRFG